MKKHLGYPRELRCKTADLHLLCFIPSTLLLPFRQGAQAPLSKA